MELLTLQAQRRTESGKGVARKLREKGQAPAVCYSRGQDATLLTIEPRTLVQLLRGPYGQNALFQLQIDGDAEGSGRTVIIRELQVHPLKRRVLHVDFWQIADDTDLTLDVPVRLEGRSAGEKAGGKVQWVLRTLRIRCCPGVIPAEIVIDVTPIESGQTLTVADLALPEGVTAVTPPRTPVLIVKGAGEAEVAVAPAKKKA